MIRSIRGRLLLGTVAGTLTIVLIGGAIVYSTTHNRLRLAFDDALVARARLLGSLVEREDDAFEFEVDYRSLPEFARADRPEYFEILRHDGTTIARSPSMKAKGLITLTASEPGLVPPLTLPDGRSGRAAIVESVARDDSKAQSVERSRIRIIVARETAGLEHELSELRRLLIGIALGVTGLSAAVLVGVVWSGMRPLNRLAGQIAGLRADDLSDRIALPNAPGELAPVVDRTNQLLERLEIAMERERSFTADVAHELRTPLSGFRSILEVALSRQRVPHEYQSAMTQCLRIVAQMQTMTGNLLSLARLDRGQMSVESAPAGLDALLRECWEPFQHRAEEKSVQVKWDTAPGAIDTDREILRLVFANIFDNAVVYVNPGGEIRVETGFDQGTAFVRVTNTGSQILEEDAQRVFERFWRGDVSRQAVGLHAGLGLSLARRLATLLRGSIGAASKPGGCFTLTLRLPVAAGKTHPNEARREDSAVPSVRSLTDGRRSK